jgi:hypothetical protein
MKSLTCFLFLLFFTVVFVFGQTTKEEAKKLARPADCGVSQYDDFKNSSFNLLSELLKTDTNYEKIKVDISGYVEGEKEVTIDGVKGDISRLKSLKGSLESMDERVASLTTDGNDLLENATKVKPVTKVKAATDNTKESLKAVDLSKKMIDEISGQVEEDIKSLTELLPKEE